MKLISFMPNQNSLEEYNNLKDIFLELEIDGIETIISDYCPEEIYRALPIKGAHLIYFPDWLDFWLGKKNECYGMYNKNEIVASFKSQFELAKKYKVQYMVFHVSNVKTEDIFTFSSTYSDWDVLSAILEIVNEVFVDEGPLLLFENLPWEGLNFRDYSLTKFFIESVNYKNKGFVLDLSHLMCLNKNIENFDEGADFIIAELEKIKELTRYIFGLHLNGSISKKYISQDFDSLYEKWKNANAYEKFSIEMEHIKAIDTHSIFESHKLKNILNILPLKYITLELAHTSLKNLLEKVKIQNIYLK